MRIAIVEDDPGVQVVLSRKLEMLRQRWPDAVITLLSTREGLREYLAGLPSIDVAFLDLRLPDAETKDMIEQALELEQTTPVVIMTGWPDDARKMLADSPIEVIEKDSGFLRGMTVFEAIGRALFRHPEKDRAWKNIRWMQEFIKTQDAPQE